MKQSSAVKYALPAYLFLITGRNNLHSQVGKYSFTWFSRCPRCLGQFPEFKEIKNRHKKSEFQIMSISTGLEKDIPAWEKVIHQKPLNWLQYLDVNGKIAENFFISEFPANFLIDQSGKIIARDIEPGQLSNFPHNQS